MKRVLLALLIFTPTLVFSQSKAPSGVVKIQIEATELDKKLLLDKLNAHSSGHHIHFEGAEENYIYRVVFSTGQEVYPTMFGGMNSSTASASVFDSTGKELFQIKRAGRSTDSGATNALAKEIVKRLLTMQ
jgi:hypothetical protein